MQIRTLKKALAVSLTAALLLSVAACSTQDRGNETESAVTPTQTEAAAPESEKASETEQPASEAAAPAAETTAETEKASENETTSETVKETEAETTPEETETEPETEPELTEEDIQNAALAAVTEAYPGLSVEGLVRTETPDVEWNGLPYHLLSDLPIDESAYGNPFAARLAKAAENNAFQEDGYLVFLEGELYPSYFVERDGYQILPVSTGRKEGVYQVLPFRNGETYMEYLTLLADMTNAYSDYGYALYNTQYYLHGTITETAEDGTYMMVDGEASRYEEDGTESKLTGTFRVATVPGETYSYDGTTVSFLTVFAENEEGPAFPVVAEEEVAEAPEAEVAETAATETEAAEVAETVAVETKAAEEENVLRVAVVEASRLGKLKMGVYNQILPEIRVCEKILSNRMHIAGTVYTAELDGTTIEYRLPDSWMVGENVLVREGNSLSFVQKASDMEDCGGYLFSLMFFEDDSYTDLPSMQVVTQANGKTLVAMFPTDVQYNADTAAEYHALWEDVPAILDTINVR